MKRLMTDYEPPRTKPRTLKAMREYLRGHPRYHTMNSWNRATSYSRCIKLQEIEFPDKETENTAYDMIGSDGEWWEASGLRGEINDFDRRWNHGYQLGTNGRSGGYLVVYQGGRKLTGHKSYCTACGQRNFALIVGADDTPRGLVRRAFFAKPTFTAHYCLTQSEVEAVAATEEEKRRWIAEALLEYERADKNVTVGNQCGRCNKATRVNYPPDRLPMEKFSYPGKSLDDDTDFADWDRGQLQSRVELVWDLDATVERMAHRFVEYCQSNTVEEEEVLVSKTVRVARPKGEDSNAEAD
jgi:hypothetical protein